MDSDGDSCSISILFVCMGNICRSPMAEFLLKDMVNKNKPSNRFIINSAAVTDEQLGKDIAIGTKKELDKRSIPYQKRMAVKLRKEDYDKYDYIIAMDEKIIEGILKIVEKDSKNKIYKLLDFSNKPRDIVDPAETNDFERTYKEIKEGCDCFYNYLISHEIIKKNTQLRSA